MNFAGKIRNMMAGRYGADKFNIFLLAFSFAISLIAQLFELYFLSLAASALLVYAGFRTLSKNIGRRSDENKIFLAFWNPFCSWFSSKFQSIQDSKTHKHLKCPKCSQKIRIPRGRGKINITCPACHEEFVRKS